MPFKHRRERLARRLNRPALFAAGTARSRNFPNNHYPFRAESHFLYLVGASLEGCLLELSTRGPTLYCPEPEPDASLWVGAVPSLSDLEAELELRVAPLAELAHLPAEAAVLPPQDAKTAVQLSALLGRQIEPGTGSDVSGADAELADALIAERLTHDHAALEQIRLAIAISAGAHRAGMLATRPGDRESVVRAQIEQVMAEADMTPAYGSIVTTHGNILHNTRYHRVMRAGDLLLCDAGAETALGWASDITRTWPVGGRYSASQRDAYDLVRKVQQQALERIRPGVEFRDLHVLASQDLTEGLVELGIFQGDPQELWADGAADVFFPHGLGHLLGLDVHDMEDLGDRAGYAPGRTRIGRRGARGSFLASSSGESAHGRASGIQGNERYLRLDRPLHPNMVVTIEPGFYRIPELRQRVTEGPLGKALNASRLAQFDDVRGIRIEDDVLVTEHGSEVLSRALTTDRAEIEALVRSH